MQSLGMIVTAGLGVLVIAEGAYIVRTRTQLATLSDKVEALSAEATREPEPFRRPAVDDPGFDADDSPRGAAPGAHGKLPPPRFTPEPAAIDRDSGDPLPLPPVIGTPEAREQLRQFVVAQLERERQEARVRDEQRMVTRMRERRLAAVQPLGLSSAETEKFLAITDKVDAARSSLRDRVEAGQLDRGSIRQEMTALREQSDRELKGLLGDERMKKYEETRRDQGPPEGGPPFGRGFGRGRGPGGGAPAAGGPPGP
jgi:hypothetical protein